MAITPLTVTIDLNPSYKKIPAVYVSQLDNNLRSLAITVQDGGVNYDVASSGYDVYVEGTKPDKHGFSYKVTDIGGTVVGSVVTVPMQTQMTCVQGMVPTEIVLKSGADRIGSANFLLVVERAGLAEDVDVSETDIPAYIDGAQQAAAAAAQSADDAEDAKDLAVSAAETAQGVLESIPEDYTTLSNDVDDLKGAIDPSVERYNWYDPNESCVFVAADGTSRRFQTDKNSDGTWTSYATNVNHGQVLYKSLDESKVLPAGTYTLSARITLNEGYTGSDIGAFCKIGLSSTNTQVNMKTERGGDINISAGEKTGWVKVTQTLSAESPFVFGIEAKDQATQAIPYTVDYIQLNSGSYVLEYSTDLYRVADKTARTMSETAQVTAETAQAMAETIVIFGNNSRVNININENSVSFNQDLMVFMPNERVNISPATAAEMLGSAASYDSETGYVAITVPNSSALVYDIASKDLRIVNTISHELDQIVLFATYYKNHSGYLWTKFFVDRVRDGYYMKAALANILLTSNGRFEVNPSAKTISFAGSMYIDTFGSRITISAASVAESIPTKAVYDSEANKVTITLVSGDCLVYSLASSQLTVKRTVDVDDINLFSEYYGNDYGLIWDKYWRDKWIDESENNLLTAVKVFNGEPYTGSYDWQTPVTAYGALFNGKQNVESFAFFTDPHTLGFADTERNETRMENSFKRIQKVYNSTPCSFMVCGGDWLNNSTTKNEACYRLGYLKGIAKNMFKDFYLVLGNHDTNYQGKESADSTNNTGRLTDATVASIMYRDTNTKKAYYSFDGSNSKCYVLDTGVEHNTMLLYDWEQVDWLGEQLAADDAEHAIIFMHILMQGDAVQTNASNFGTLVEAYNNHATVTLNSKTYDFTGCTGHVDFFVAGHTHQDSTGTLGGIPYFITATNAYNSDVPLIDLVLVDYDAGTINLVRVGGTGSDRVINM